MFDIKTMTLGVTYERYGSDERYIQVCSCGHVEQLSYLQFRNHDYMCSECLNTNFVRLTGTDEGYYEFIDTLEKTNISFKIKLYEVKVYINRETNKISMNIVDEYIVEFNLLEKKLNLYKNNKQIAPSLKNFAVFDSVDKIKLINAISTEASESLYDIAFSRLSKQMYETAYKKGRGLSRLFDKTYLQILSTCGFNKKALSNCHACDSILHKDETEPHKILGLPKYMLSYIKDSSCPFSHSNKNTLLELHNRFDGNTMKTVMQIFSEESTVERLLYCSAELLQLNKEYNYKDIVKLVLYATREVKLQQGISSPSEVLRLLRDYLRMSKALNHMPEKYPDSLKKVHDVTQMNYRLFEDEIKEKEFQLITSSDEYKRLEYAYNEYAITIPETIKDVIKEGENLSHCVASYVQDIINKKCYIVFLRLNKYQQESLVTIEVRNGQIKQTRGKFNRETTLKEKEFIALWARNKGLEIQIY